MENFIFVSNQDSNQEADDREEMFSSYYTVYRKNPVVLGKDVKNMYSCTCPNVL